MPSSSSISFVEPPSSCSSPQADHTNTTEPGSAEPTSAFSSKQIKSRSLIKAARNLPQSPRQKAEVLQGLVKKYETRIQFKENRGRPRKDLSDEQQQWLTTFLERSDITYMNPGRKDCVYSGKVDGDRKYEQRRYLLWTLHDLLEIINGNSFIENEESFITWNIGTPMTFAQLYDFVKENKAYSFNKSIPHATCLCEVCENCVLLVKGFNKCKNIFETLPTNPHDLIEKYACDSNLKDCMRNICTVCNTDECINLYIKCDELSDHPMSQTKPTLQLLQLATEGEVYLQRGSTKTEGEVLQLATTFEETVKS